MNFKGKVAVVTRASAGIGKSVSELYAKEGAAVVLSDINEKLGEQTTAEIRKAGGEATFVLADVSKPADCENMVKAAVEFWVSRTPHPARMMDPVPERRPVFAVPLLASLEFHREDRHPAPHRPGCSHGRGTRASASWSIACRTCSAPSVWLRRR